MLEARLRHGNGEGRGEMGGAPKDGLGGWPFVTDEEAETPLK